MPGRQKGNLRPGNTEQGRQRNQERLNDVHHAPRGEKHIAQEPQEEDRKERKNRNAEQGQGKHVTTGSESIGECAEKRTRRGKRHPAPDRDAEDEFIPVEDRDKFPEEDDLCGDRGQSQRYRDGEDAASAPVCGTGGNGLGGARSIHRIPGPRTHRARLPSNRPSRYRPCPGRNDRKTLPLSSRFLLQPAGGRCRSDSLF